MISRLINFNIKACISIDSATRSKKLYQQADAYSGIESLCQGNETGVQGRLISMISQRGESRLDIVVGTTVKTNPPA
jgi:hypothetical protein